MSQQIAVEENAATVALGEAAFADVEAKTSELFTVLQGLYEKKGYDHELVVLLSPLYLPNDLGTEAATAQLSTMWTGLKERFLDGRYKNPEEEISSSDLHHVFEQLVYHLEEAIREARGETVMVVGESVKT